MTVFKEGEAKGAVVSWQGSFYNQLGTPEPLSIVPRGSLEYILGAELGAPEDYVTIASRMPGSQMKMTPYINEEVKLKLNLDLKIPNNEVILNNDIQILARTKNNNNPTGIVSIGMGTPKFGGLELKIPPNTPVGDYQTNLIWKLVNGPMN